MPLGIYLVIRFQPSLRLFYKKSKIIKHLLLVLLSVVPLVFLKKLSPGNEELKDFFIYIYIFFVSFIVSEKK